MYKSRQNDKMNHITQLQELSTQYQFDFKCFHSPSPLYYSRDIVCISKRKKKQKQAITPIPLSYLKPEKSNKSLGRF